LLCGGEKVESEILQKAIEIKECLTKTRRHIHQHPELGFKEFETTSFVKKELESMGVELVPLKTETGVLGILRGEKKGSDVVTALRADMDALPIVEQTGLPYASRNEGVMHACGHDGHTAGLLGVAKLLSSMKDKFSGTVKLVFQPAEEVLGGAEGMVESGVLENPKVDTIIALHGWPSLEVGKIGVFSGPYMASADKFTVKIIGSGGHGAYPHTSADPVLAAAHAVVALQDIVSREIDALDRVQKTIEEKMDRIIKGVTSTFGCKYELEYLYKVPMLVNDPEVINLVSEAANDVLGEGHVVQSDRPAMSSEDFSIFINNVAHGAFFRKLHNDHFNFNDRVLPIGVAVLTQFVLLKNQ
jgi:metal-dependent amidase/aminoacylase/carboxypeptidase family protein